MREQRARASRGDAIASGPGARTRNRRVQVSAPLSARSRLQVIRGWRDARYRRLRVRSNGSPRLTVFTHSVERLAISYLNGLRVRRSTECVKTVTEDVTPFTSLITAITESREAPPLNRRRSSIVCTRPRRGALFIRDRSMNGSPNSVRSVARSLSPVECIAGLKRRDRSCWSRKLSALMPRRVGAMPMRSMISRGGILSRVESPRHHVEFAVTLHSM